jgi:hypothetical protein
LKNKETLTLALTKYTDELGKIRERLDWTKSWLDAANFMQVPDLFIAQVKERDELQKREQEMDFKIRFVKWVLEDEQPKGN